MTAAPLARRTSPWASGPLPLRPSTLQVGGVRSDGIEVGEGEVCLIWFPALLDSARSFAPVALALAARYSGRLRVCAYDPPGYGERRGGEGVPGFQELEDWSQDLLAKLGRRVVLAGNSSGAVIAVGAFSRDPEAVVGLAFVGWCDWRLVGRPHTALLCPGTEEELDRLIARGWHTPPQLLAGTRAAQLERSRSADYRAHVRSFDPERFGSQLDAYEGPLALVAGESDGVITPEMIRALACKRRDAALVILQSCGHYPHRERPDGLEGALASWMEERRILPMAEAPPSVAAPTRPRSRAGAGAAGV